MQNASIHGLLADLNQQQSEAVTQPLDRHCLVLAGAGCGKTTVLMRRIAYCIHTYCAPQTILALTFTRKAADEMRQRLQGFYTIPNKLLMPCITTFHGLSYRLLHDKIGGVSNFRRIGYTQEPRLLSSVQRIDFIANLSTAAQRRAFQLDLASLDNLIAQYETNPEKLKHLPNHGQQFIRELAHKLHVVKKKKNMWEFSDMVVQAVKLFSRFPSIANHYTQFYHAILVDEFQDTNPVQLSMVCYFLKEKNKLYAVGDDDQAIYGFRGADHKIMTQFISLFPNAKIMKLETNYRSYPAILNAANKVFKNKPRHFRKILRCGVSHKSHRLWFNTPLKHTSCDQKAMITWIFDKISQISCNEHIAVEKMVLLFRLNETRTYAKDLAQTLFPQMTQLPQFMTIHSCKGLEFTVVFLCDLEESQFPYYVHKRMSLVGLLKDNLIQAFSGKNIRHILYDVEEEKRLFYVGITRARKYLFLLSVREKYRGRRKVSLQPSRFLRII